MAKSMSKGGTVSRGITGDDWLADEWLALVIGNTRSHWGFFSDDQLISSWHTSHLSREAAAQLSTDGFTRSAWLSVLETAAETTVKTNTTKTNTTTGHTNLVRSIPSSPLLASQLWIASAVPAQTTLWLTATREQARTVKRDQIPLAGIYPTMGSDRAINLLGAAHTVGWPALVIDAGTALTFTAGIAAEPETTQRGHRSGRVYGGAILPGLRLQSQALGEKTAALADAVGTVMNSTMNSTAMNSTTMNSTSDDNMLDAEACKLPDRWGCDTETAIASGLVYGTISSIADYLTDWWKQFPNGKAVITGGDGPMLYALLQQAIRQNALHTQQTPEAIASGVCIDTQLMFWGMQAYRQIALRGA